MLKGLKRQAGILAVTLLSCTGGVAADIPAKTPTLEPVPVPRSWEFTFTPYAWIVIDKGTLSLGNRSAPIDTNVFKLLDYSDHLYALMSYQEMRYGPVALYANVFWSKIGASNTRTGYWEIGDFINVEAVADVSTWATMAISSPESHTNFLNGIPAGALRLWTSWAAAVTGISSRKLISL